MISLIDLQKVTSEEFAKPYKFGVWGKASDCFFTGLAVIDAVKGTEYRKKYSGRYRTLRGAQKALRKEGHKTLVTFFADLLPQIPPAMAKAGDLAIVDVDGAEHVAVCNGLNFMAKIEDGLMICELGDCKAAFEVL